MSEIKKPDPVSNIISNGADKKSLQYLAIVLLIAILVGLGLFYYLSLMPKTEIEEDITEKLREARRAKIVKQLEELEKQKEEIPPLPREEILRQLKELNK